LGPDLGFRLRVRVNGQALELRCSGHEAELYDKDRTPLGHVRCDFVFRASLPLQAGAENELSFRDGSYLGEEGKIDLSFAETDALKIVHKTGPDDALKKRSLLEREPGDDDRLRELRVRF